jgi:hypothetical protein
MSGPKVVRVVTREELEAICRRHIALVEAALREVRATLKRYDLVDRELENGLSARRDELVTLLERGKFAELQERAPGIAEYCRAEAKRVEAKAVAAIEAARSRRRRLSDAARSLIAALEAGGTLPSEALREVVSRSLVASESELDGLERVVDEAIKTLASSSKATGEAKREISELAGRLGAGEHGVSLGAWLAQNGDALEAGDDRLDKVLAEIELLGDATMVREYSERAARIAGETAVSRRRLLTDSLVLDASNAAGRLRTIEAFRSRLRDAHAALTTYSTDDARRQAVIVAEALGSATMQVNEGLLEEANAAIERAQAELATAARRKAILGGLAALGYEVREGMATAWTRNGRLIVKKPNATDYGVELAAPEDASRLQVRLVGAANPVSARSAGRDRDHEAMWCSEFGKLRELVADAGGDVVIERALAVGAQPVKTVAFEGIAATETEEAAQPGQRTL